MTRAVFSALLVLAGPLLTSAGAADEGEAVFRSDVSLVRVDAQVVDRDNRAITGLRVEDFILREEGRPQPIRNFSTENMPLDILLLFDVSASMRPHVERIASAAHEAFRVLGDRDRVGIMVFDRSTRLRMGFREGRDSAERELDSLLRQESFRGGTDITRGLLDAADYVRRQGRREARRAIVIVTDDQTEFNRDEDAVSRALTRADAVLSALIAPDAMHHGMGRRGGMGGGGWPGMGGGVGGPLGGIILGPRGPYGGRGPRQGGGMGYPRTRSAGTSEIARASGGDSMPVDDASALETTLTRIRQRYALHFYLPPDVKAGQERNIEVALADAARRRYPNAEVRYRRVYLAPANGGSSGAASEAQPAVVTRNGDPAPAPEPRQRRRVAADGSGPSHDGPLIDDPAADDPKPAAAPANADPKQAAAPASAAPQPKPGGWRRLKPGEQP